jgi:hypothetical protein
VWKYDLRDWHEGLGIPLEQWWADLLADGWEPNDPHWTEGSVIELNGRMVRRHAVKRWVPDARRRRSISS